MRGKKGERRKEKEVDGAEQSKRASVCVGRCQSWGGNVIE